MARKDPRPFIRLTQTFPEHPKVEILSDRAFRVLVELLCWSKRAGTDGVIPNEILHKRAPARCIKELSAPPPPPFVSPLLEAIDGGWVIHDFLKHQESVDEVEELSGKRKAAGQAGGRAKAGQAKTAASVSGKADGGPTKRQASAKQVPEPLLSKTEADKTRQDKTVPQPNGCGADDLVAEWLERVKRPPSSVIGQVGKHLKAMLAEGIDPDDVRRGLAQWARKGLNPSALPGVVNEVMNSRPRTAADKAKATLALQFNEEAS